MQRDPTLNRIQLDALPVEGKEARKERTLQQNSTHGFLQKVPVVYVWSDAVLVTDKNEFKISGRVSLAFHADPKLRWTARTALLIACCSMGEALEDYCRFPPKLSRAWPPWISAGQANTISRLQNQLRVSRTMRANLEDAALPKSLIHKVAQKEQQLSARSWPQKKPGGFQEADQEAETLMSAIAS